MSSTTSHTPAQTIPPFPHDSPPAPGHEPLHAWRALAFAGSIMAGLQVVVLLTSRPAEHLNPRAFDNPWLGWLAVGGSLLAYLMGYRAVVALPPSRGRRALILALPLAFCVPATLVMPFDSTDLFGYINRGWQQAGHGVNPYVTPLGEMPDWDADPMFREHWLDNPAPYGFLFVGLARELCNLGDGHWRTTFLLFKLTNLLAFALGAGLLFAGCRLLRRPDPDRALYLYLWSPLLLFHVLANGHNDLLMCVAGQLGLVLTMLGVGGALLPGVVTGVLIKYVVGVTLPLATVYSVRRFGWRTTAAGAALGLSIVALAAAPYVTADWHRFRLWAIAGNATLANHSLPDLVYETARATAERVFGAYHLHALLLQAVKGVFWLGFFLVHGRLLLRRCRAESYPLETFLWDVVLVQFLLVCVVSSKFMPWYLAMFFPLALWLPEGDRLRQMVCAVAVGQVTALTDLGQSLVLSVGLLQLAPMAAVLVLAWKPREAVPATPATTVLAYRGAVDVPTSHADERHRQHEGVLLVETPDAVPARVL